MIIATVGTQLPFDRLIKMLDEIAPALQRKVFAQTGRGTYVPKHLDWRANVSAAEFDIMLAEASVLVAHAGIGTVLKAYQYKKPIVLVPRRAAHGEHRNDHQLATVSGLAGRSGIYVAHSQDELRDILSMDLSAPSADPQSMHGRQRLQEFVKNAAAI